VWTRPDGTESVSLPPTYPDQPGCEVLATQGPEHHHPGPADGILHPGSPCRAAAADVGLAALQAQTAVTGLRPPRTRLPGPEGTTTAPCIYPDRPLASVPFGAALEHIRQAVDLWLETAREFGDPIPEPKGERLMLA